MESFFVEGKELHAPGEPASQGSPGDMRLEIADLRGDPNGIMDSLNRLGHMAALGELLGSFLHDLRNSLVSIKVLAELLPERHGDEDFRDSLHGLVMNEIGRTERQIRALLDLNRPALKQICPANLNELVRESEEMVAGEARDRNISLVNELSSDLGAVRTDRRRAKQILVGLLLSVLRSVSPGGTLHAETRELIEQDGIQEKRFAQIGLGGGREMNPSVGEGYARQHLAIALLRGAARDLGGTIVFNGKGKEGGGAFWCLRLPMEGEGGGGER
jgi:signal transduction histidine kinase